MKIVQISTYDISGGAARAAYRLQKGLREMGHDSRMLVRHKSSEDRYVHPIVTEPSREEGMQEFLLGRVIQEHCINLHRTGMSNTMFSLPYPGYDIARMPAPNEADVINLHWVAQFQSPVTLRNLCLLGKPVVWTLHDQWAFTGGCHYSAGCKRFQSDCCPCPQLSDDLCLLPGAILQDTLEFFKGITLTFVSPSRWMADCLRKSRLFHDHRVEVIPNSIETDVFCPISKQMAKEALGLKGDTFTVLFGGEDANERRKGFPELIYAVNHIRDRSEFQAMIDANRLSVLCFGRPSRELDSMNLPVVALGYLGSDQEIRNAYCAADVFVLPSLEDNLPNTVLEAMSCGTPVVGFEIGGMPDMVESGVTGLLAPAGDTDQLGEALMSLLLDSGRRESMGAGCRQKIEAEYRLHVQALRYSSLYEELIAANKPIGYTGARYDGATWEESFEENPPASVPLQAALGTHFEKIYDAILFDSLKESALQIYQNWQDAESDRTARLQVIQDQGKRIVALEAEVDRWLNESKRLQDVNRAMNAQQKWRWTKNSGAHMVPLEERIKEIEEDRTARLQVIQDQGKRIVALEAEVDRWLNECKRLQRAYSEIETDRDELKMKMVRYKGCVSLRGLKRKLPLVLGGLRRGFLTLKGMKNGGLGGGVSVLKSLSGGAAYGCGKEDRAQNDFRVPLASFKRSIDDFNASQPNREMLESIRSFNHHMVDQFNRMFPLKGGTFLDVGASPHGYALESALSCGVSLYVGIGLDINQMKHVAGEGGSVGMLLKMDASDLKFPDGMFDVVFSISAFEHISNVTDALNEIDRVLYVGGCAMISFEPIWSCSYGHHLHHFAGCSDLVPPWAHLIWSPDQMRDHLSQKWPAEAPLSLEEAIGWIYRGDSINRLNIRQFKALFDHCRLRVRWSVDLEDDGQGHDPLWVRKVSETTGLDPQELMTKGLCMLLTKGPP